MQSTIDERLKIGGYRTNRTRNVLFFVAIGILVPFVFFSPWMLSKLAEGGDATGHSIAAIWSALLMTPCASAAYGEWVRLPAHYPHFVDLVPKGLDFPETGLVRWVKYKRLELKHKTLILYDYRDPDADVCVPLGPGRKHRQAAVDFIRKHAPARLKQGLPPA